MSFTIKGKLVKILNLESGVARSGNPWKKQEFVIETFDQFPRKICFTLFNDKVALLNSVGGEGTTLEVSFDIESREFNNKWYHNLNAWKIEKENPRHDGAFIPPVGTDDIPPEPLDAQPDDLPF